MKKSWTYWQLPKSSLLYCRLHRQLISRTEKHVPCQTSRNGSLEEGTGNPVIFSRNTFFAFRMEHSASNEIELKMPGCKFMLGFSGRGLGEARYQRSAVCSQSRRTSPASFIQPSCIEKTVTSWYQEWFPREAWSTKQAVVGWIYRQYQHSSEGHIYLSNFHLTVARPRSTMSHNIERRCMIRETWWMGTQRFSAGAFESYHNQSCRKYYNAPWPPIATTYWFIERGHVR